jgi:Translation initiation factor 1 (eIF-1/SUI1) and related proteins
MAQKDWKDILNTTLAASTQEKAEATIKQEIPQKDKEASEPRQNFIIRFEKRNGKPATIVSNFEGSEQELKDLAAKLKKHCGVGGSAKDDEILIQGDVCTKVAEFLRKQNHSVRGDLKK